MEISRGDSTLGKVPATNLLRLEAGSVFTFASRRWQVATIHGDNIKVRPTERPASVELQFGRVGAPLDPAVLDEIRELLSSGEVGSNVVPVGTRDHLVSELTPLQAFCSAELPPVAQVDDSYVYLTFAGSLANQVLGRWAAGDAADTSEYTITTQHPISFEDVPIDPNDLVEHLGGIEMPAEQASEFQRMLPGELRRGELCNEWLQRPTHLRTLERLKTARQVDLPAQLIGLVDR